MKQIFKLLREDTTNIPAELTEEQLKLILQRVGSNKTIDTDTKSQKSQPTNKPYNNKSLIKRAKSFSSNDPKPKLDEKKPGGKPMWNAPKKTGKPKMSNTEKDPFYNEKKALIEERRLKRLEKHQAMVEKNDRKYQDFLRKKNDDDVKKIEKRQATQMNTQMSTNEFTNRQSLHRQSIASSSISTMDNYNPNQNIEESRMVDRGMIHFFISFQTLSLVVN